MRRNLLFLIFLLLTSFFLLLSSQIHAQSCPDGDANSDCKIDGLDYVVWLNHYNLTVTNGPSGGDFNSNGTVDGVDYVVWLNHYGLTGNITPTVQISPSATPNPNPDPGYQALISAFQTIRTQSLFPVSGKSLTELESAFGPRVRVSTGGYDFHAGVDIDGPYRTPILAPLEGTLHDVVNFANGGTTVILRHTFAQPVQYLNKTLQYFYTFYMHLDSVTPSLMTAKANNQNPSVAKGFEVGKMGHTGNALGDHLHWEMRVGSWCSLEFQLSSPSSSCSGFGFDSAMHPLFLYPPAVGNMKLTWTTVPSGSQDGKASYSSSPDAPILNRIEFVITDKTANQIVKSHTLDYNRRIGFNASTSVSLDSQDKTKPYISPVSFGPTAPEYKTDIIVPKSFLGSFTGTNYSYKIVASDIWENKVEVSQ